ncbi:hypothetical protein LN047_02220 [Achromobacter sp. JD417]|uniref:hypothetical protein n=1 Tax=Achromobacter sp. JD417 TaxID=2893881 RepID=UPI0035A5A048
MAISTVAAAPPIGCASLAPSPRRANDPASGNGRVRHVDGEQQQAKAKLDRVYSGFEKRR